MKPKTKRKAVKAWALVLKEDGRRVATSFDSPDFSAVGKDEEVVELVERDRHAERVLKAALAWAVAEEDTYGNTETTLALGAAIEAYEKARRK